MPTPMYLWRRLATEKWSNENEARLRTIAGDSLAIIQRANRKQLQFEIASKRHRELEIVKKRFGGRIRKLPHDWLKRSLRQKTTPIKVGTKQLTIPAGAAFGTGEHATTAMCLKMLVRLFRGARAPRVPAITPSRSRPFKKTTFRRGAEKSRRGRLRPPETVIDLGTGSGVLALAAKILGARRIIGIDNDPIAISTAKQNARLNKVRGVNFRTENVQNSRIPNRLDVVTANLFSELLIEILPKIRAARWLILSGVLRSQEQGVRRALNRNQLDVFDVRRRGKWVAMLAGRK